MRSAIMVICYLIALLLGRKRKICCIRCLCAAFLTLLLIPASLFDLSFQLSFSAVLGNNYSGAAVAVFIPNQEQDPFDNRKSSALKNADVSFVTRFFVSTAAILVLRHWLPYPFTIFLFLGIFF